MSVYVVSDPESSARFSPAVVAPWEGFTEVWAILCNNLFGYSSCSSSSTYNLSSWQFHVILICCRAGNEGTLKYAIKLFYFFNALFN